MFRGRLTRSTRRRRRASRSRRPMIRSGEVFVEAHGGHEVGTLAAMAAGDEHAEQPDGGRSSSRSRGIRRAASISAARAAIVGRSSATVVAVVALTAAPWGPRRRDGRGARRPSHRCSSRHLGDAFVVHLAQPHATGRHLAPGVCWDSWCSTRNPSAVGTPRSTSTLTDPRDRSSWFTKASPPTSWKRHRGGSRSKNASSANRPSSASSR